MMKQINRIAIAAFVLLLLASLLVTSRVVAPLPAAAQQSIAACSSGYVLWADSLSGSVVLDWSSSDTYAQGKVHSNRGIDLSGSDNVITGAIEFVTSFSDEGDGNQYTPPVQVSPGIIPISYDVADYQPGGTAAAAAEAEGRYHYVDGDFEVSDGNVQLDGLYFVTGEVVLSGSDLYGTATIVARRQIEIGGSLDSLTPYSDGLLLFSDQTANNEPGIEISGSDSDFAGMIFAPGAQIVVSGSGNAFSGGLYARTIELGGSALSLLFDEQYCPSEPPPTPTPTSTLPPPTRGPIADYLPVLMISAVNTMGEPNNDCRQAYALNTGVLYQFLAEDLHDWYDFTLAEPGDLTIRLTDFVPLAGQIAVFRGDCDAYVFLGNNGDSTAEKTLTLGPQPAGRYLVYISNDGAFNTADPYSLLVEVR